MHCLINVWCDSVMCSGTFRITIELEIVLEVGLTFFNSVYNYLDFFIFLAIVSCLIVSLIATYCYCIIILLYCSCHDFISSTMLYIFTMYLITVESIFYDFYDKIILITSIYVQIY